MTSRTKHQQPRMHVGDRPTLRTSFANAMTRTAARALGRAFRGPELLGEPIRQPDAPRRPVVLVNGMGAHDEIWEPFRCSLTRDGFEVKVFADSARGVGDMTSTAGRLAEFLGAVQSRAGADAVDVIGYGAGGLVARKALQIGTTANVKSLVTLGTPHQGVGGSAGPKLSKMFGPWGTKAGKQMLTGSKWLRDLGTSLSDGTRVTSVMSADGDGLVWPASSPMLPGAKNVQLVRDGWLPGRRGPAHFAAVQRSDEAYEAVRTVLVACRDV